MPILPLVNADVRSNGRIAKKAERPKAKLSVMGGKDFAFFIPFFLTEKKSGKKERPSADNK